MNNFTKYPTGVNRDGYKECIGVTQENINNVIAHLCTK